MASNLCWQKEGIMKFDSRIETDASWLMNCLFVCCFNYAFCVCVQNITIGCCFGVFCFFFCRFYLLLLLPLRAVAVGCCVLLLGAAAITSPHYNLNQFFFFGWCASIL